MRIADLVRRFRESIGLEDPRTFKEVYCGACDRYVCHEYWHVAGTATVGTRCSRCLSLSVRPDHG